MNILKRLFSREGSEYRFDSPEALRQFAIDTASELRAAGMADAADTLERAARYVTGSGWEWLGVLGTAAKQIRPNRDLSDELRQKLKRVAKAGKSRHPYRC